MNVLLVNPRNRFSGFIVIPNLALGYLAGAVRAAGHEVTVLDAARDELTLEQFRQAVARGRYDVVGLNVFSPSFAAAADYARAVREVAPAAVVVAGGPHPTFEPVETLLRIPAIDYVVAGEGEIALPRLLACVSGGGVPSTEALRALPNLAWRDGGTVACNPVQRVDDLDALAPVAWDLLAPDRFPTVPNGVFSRKARIAPIITTRGCPYRCAFCGARHTLGSRVRVRSAEAVVAEMAELQRRFGVEEIHVLDDGFTQDRAHALRVCEHVRRARLGLPWAIPSGVRLDTLDVELLRAMEDAGVYSMAVGIEAGSQRVLDLMKKHLTLATIREKVALIKRHTRIRVTGFFILGFPGETLAEARQTVQLALELPIDRANFFNFTPFPGSEIHAQLRASGQLRGVSYDDLFIHHVRYGSAQIPAPVLQALQAEAHVRFYSRPRILLPLLREVRTLAQVRVLARRAAAIVSST